MNQLPEVKRTSPGRHGAPRASLRWAMSVAGRVGECGAFTLVEMMVVVVIIGILTAMIIPEMKGTYEDALLRSTCRELIGACSVAASRAVSLNQTHRVRLDRRASRFLVESRVGKANGGPKYSPVVEVAGAQGELDSRISVQVRQTDRAPETVESSAPMLSDDGLPTSPPTEAITFNPDGTADAADILLRDRAGFRLVLRVNPITARVRLLEGARASPIEP